jgi:hypothetical protein
MLVATVLVSFGLLAGSPAIPSAHAELAACYSDPVVVLSDGTTLDLSDTIYDSETDVQQVSYVLHGPVGTVLISITPSSGALGPKETFLFHADQGAQQYAVGTLVSTLASGVGVVASAKAVDGIQVSTASETGWNDQQLHLSLNV